MLTLFVWDGDVMVQEVHADKTVTYVYEPDSFVPLARVDSAGCKYIFGPSSPHICQIPEWVHVNGEPNAHLKTWSMHWDGKREEEHRQHWKKGLRTIENAAAGDRILYYQCDHLGTPLVLSDERGNVTWMVSYLAWGRTFRKSKIEMYQPLRMRGQYEDLETKLYYNRHRYYDPDIGRFISQDPIKLLGGYNFYSYAKNPVLWSDPLGLKSEWQTNWEAVHGALPDGFQVHHIIPKSLDSVAAAKKLCPNFNVHDESNLIALPKDSTVVVPGNKTGFGKTTHQGYHGGYSVVAEYAMKVATRIKANGISGCAKLKAIQSGLRSQLEVGGQTMYGNQHPNGVPGVVGDWKTTIRNYLRSQ